MDPYRHQGYGYPSGQRPADYNHTDDLPPPPSYQSAVGAPPYGAPPGSFQQSYPQSQWQGQPQQPPPPPAQRHYAGDVKSTSLAPPMHQNGMQYRSPNPQYQPDPYQQGYLPQGPPPQNFNQGPVARPRSRSPNTASFVPVVVPQITRGNNQSPFVRAYAPMLSSFGIKTSEFVSFIDALNEAWICSPVAGGTASVGSILQLVPLGTAQAAGGAVMWAGKLGGMAVGFARAKAYLSGSNEQFWHPRGLHARMLKSDRMCEAVGIRGGSTALERDAFSQPGADARERRMNALGDSVARLSFDVPAQQAPDEWFKKMGAWASDRAAKRQSAKEERKHQRAMEKAQERSGGRKEGRREGRRERRKEGRKDRRRGRDGDADESSAAAVPQEGNRRMERAARREGKTISKMYWIVVTRSGDQPLDDEGDVSEEEEEQTDSEGAGEYHDQKPYR